MKVHRRIDFFRGCSGLAMGGWVSCNPDAVQICKSVRNIGQFLSKLLTHVLSIKYVVYLFTSGTWRAFRAHFYAVSTPNHAQTLN